VLKKWIVRFIIQVVVEDLYRNGEIARATGIYHRGPDDPDPLGEALERHRKKRKEAEGKTPEIGVHIYGNVIDHEAFTKTIVPPKGGGAA
jgi:hypothetical protein